jgi:uncharacterized membrane protein YhdT
MIRKWITLGTLFFLPFAALAQDGHAVGFRPHYHPLAHLLMPILFLLVFWLILRLAMKKTRACQQRAMEHMDRMEQKYDRIIELLAKLTERDGPKPPPPPSSQLNQ